MGIKEQVLGGLEAAVSKAVRDNLGDLSVDKLKEEAHKMVDKLIDEQIGDKLDGLAERIVANLVDKIDGEDDIPDIN
jgi:hypothetical protein